MGQIVRRALITVAALAISAGAALAEEAFFVIKRADGSRPDFAVTESVIAKVGMTTFETTLPGMDQVKHKVSGPLMRDLLAEAGIDGEVADATALDKYETEVPLADFRKFNVIAAIELDGARLSVREKGPAWIVYPRSDVPELADAIYEQRSVWQLHEVIVK